MAVASLPMYDWPEVRDATDAFWSLLRDRLRQAGLVAPAALSRDREPMALWSTPDLLVAQTCGYPYATRLNRHVALIGTPTYAIGCAPGHYCSVIVTRREKFRRPLAEFATGRFACNGTDSQSGFRAPARMMAEAGIPFPHVLLETGSHRNSIRAVAEGQADFAAIDAVSWELARAHEPAAAALAVVARTPETPGLPLITAAANGAFLPALAKAATEAIALLGETHRSALLIEGFVRTVPADYAPLAEPITGGGGTP